MIEHGANVEAVDRWAAHGPALASAPYVGVQVPRSQASNGAHLGQPKYRLQLKGVVFLAFFRHFLSNLRKFI